LSEVRLVYGKIGCVKIWWKYSCNISFVFVFILDAAHTVDACALTRILPSLTLIDTIYFTPDTKATPASVQGVGVDF
jgi:hypothetical protein